MTVDAVETSVFEIPTDQPEADGTFSWSATTVVVAEARDGDVVGTGWTYAAAACKPLIDAVLAPAVVGTDSPGVPASWGRMVRACRNLGRPGLVSCAIAAVDLALWDLEARRHGIALCRLLGQAHEEVPVYGSGGFTTYDDATLTGQLEHFVRDLGASAVKIKIGESRGTCVGRDVARTELTRRVVGDDVAVFVDANGAYGAAQAVRVGRRLRDLGVTWFEEPVSSDDLAGLQHVRCRVDADVAAGEYAYDLPYVQRMCAAGAVDCLQLDVTRIAGATEWLRAAGIAASYNIEVSGHCAPNLAVHVAAATPNIRHLEWFHDHERIETLLFDGALRPTGGVLRPDPGTPGHGMNLRPDAGRYRRG